MVLRHNGAKKHPEQRASEHNRKHHRTDCDGTQGNSVPGIIIKGVIGKTTTLGLLHFRRPEIQKWSPRKVNASPTQNTIPAPI